MRNLLQSVLVQGLFGDRDVRIEFPSDSQVSFLHGSNGAGKTTVLKLIDALFNQKTTYLQETPFQLLEVTTEEGRRASVTRSETESSQRKSRHPGSQGRPGSFRLEFEVDGVAYESSELKPDSADELGNAASRVEEILGLERIGRDRWIDGATGDSLSFNEVVRRYWDDLPASWMAAFAPQSDELYQALKSLDVRGVEFIGADRLLTRRPLRRRGPETFRGAPAQVETPVVETQREQLRRRISEQLASFAESSQILDRSFPLRLLEDLSEERTPPTPEELSLKVDEVSKLRRSLEEVGILDRGSEELTPQRAAKADDYQRRMIDLYLRDDQKKLEQLGPLRAQLELFLRLVNQKFERKQLTVDRNRGYELVAASGDRLSPSQLSSGEQHELVLLYRLIFSTAPRTLFLIDEPELSLHVAWQERITEDLEEIAGLGEAQFVLATHSPAATGDRWDLLIPLESSYKE